MKRVQYIGTNTEGIWLPGDAAHATRMGAAVEVDDDLASDLLGRRYEGKPEWRLAPKERSSTTKRTTKRARSEAPPAAPPAAPASTEGD